MRILFIILNLFVTCYPNVDTYDKLLAYCTTPSKLEWVLLTQYKYVPDYEGKDYWQSPKETIRRRKGDCEDFAILTYWIMKDKGYYTELKIVESKKSYEYHMICYYENNNECGIFSNDKLIRMSFSEYLKRGDYRLVKDVYSNRIPCLR